MEKIEAVSKTGQFQQEQRKGVQEAQRLESSFIVGRQFQKNYSRSKKNGRKDKVIADIILEKSRKSGKN